METTETTKIEIEKKSFTIFGMVMIVLFGLVIYLIQSNDKDRATEWMQKKKQDMIKEERSSKTLGNIYGKVVEGSNKVSGLTKEVESYHNEVSKNSKLHENSLKNFNQLKSQNEKTYIPDATIQQQSDFISKYKYEPIGTN